MANSIAQALRRFSVLLFGGSALLVIALLILHQAVASSEQWSLLFWFLFPVAIFIFSLSLYYQASHHTTRLASTLRTMTQTAREMARGDLDRTLAIDETQLLEVKELAEEINAMSKRAKNDIAEMKRLERVRSEFLGNVSHELRTPIFSVQGYLETLLDGAIDDANVRDQFLEKAHQNVLRLHSLLTDLIEISRIESGAMKMSFRYFDAVGHCEAIIAELRPTAEMADVLLYIETHTNGNGDISVLGDKERIKQVLVNLIDNAIKYNKNGGSVTVCIIPQETTVVFQVKDSGLGIPEEDLNRIFERFYRVNKDRSRAVGGSGLGLAIVKHIIEAHGSKIEVSSSLGEGTTFSFTLKK